MKFSKKLIRQNRREVSRMTDERLSSEIAHVEGLNTANCDWLEFRLKPGLLEALRGQERLRKRNAPNE